MNILDLPPYVERSGFKAWRNSYAYRTLRFPYVGFFVRKNGSTWELWAKPSTRLDDFIKAVEALEVETVEALAYHVSEHGTRGAFAGSYVLKDGDLTIVLDGLEKERASFVLALGGEVVFLVAPLRGKLKWFFALLNVLKGKRGA